MECSLSAIQYWSKRKQFSSIGKRHCKVTKAYLNVTKGIHYQYNRNREKDFESTVNE